MTFGRYNFDKHHDGSKQVGVNMDMCCWGMEPLGLLLFFGDLTAARNGFNKVNDAHKRILLRVRQGAASAERYVRTLVLNDIIHAQPRSE